jgi:hypothetical protein
LGDQEGASEARERKHDARDSDALAKEESDGQNKHQRRDLDDGDQVRDRHPSQRHDVTEHAEHFAAAPQQRPRMHGGRNGAPFAHGDKQETASEAGRDAAQEENLKGRKIGRHHLHEAVADDERARAGEHRGDAAEVGACAHGGEGGTARMR